jgi:hypothetical protein
LAVLAPVVTQDGLKIWSTALLLLPATTLFLPDMKQLVMSQGLCSSAVNGYPFGQIKFGPVTNAVLSVVKGDIGIAHV